VVPFHNVGFRSIAPWNMWKIAIKVRAFRQPEEKLLSSCCRIVIGDIIFLVTHACSLAFAQIYKLSAKAL